MPERIQRKRTRGWTMPPGAVFVGRPSKWGNPIDWRKYPAVAADTSIDGEYYMSYRSPATRRRWAVVDFESAVRHGDGLTGYPSREEIRQHLRGKDLVCWCPLDQPCHADVLLRIANEEVPNVDA